MSSQRALRALRDSIEGQDRREQEIAELKAMIAAARAGGGVPTDVNYPTSGNTDREKSKLERFEEAVLPYLIPTGAVATLGASLAGGYVMGKNKKPSHDHNIIELDRSRIPEATKTHAQYLKKMKDYSPTSQFLPLDPGHQAASRNYVHKHYFDKETKKLTMMSDDDYARLQHMMEQISIPVKAHAHNIKRLYEAYIPSQGPHTTQGVNILLPDNNYIVRNRKLYHTGQNLRGTMNAQKHLADEFLFEPGGLTQGLYRTAENRHDDPDYPNRQRPRGSRSRVHMLSMPGEADTLPPEQATIGLTGPAGLIYYADKVGLHPYKREKDDHQAYVLSKRHADETGIDDALRGLSYLEAVNFKNTYKARSTTPQTPNGLEYFSDPKIWPSVLHMLKNNHQMMKAQEYGDLEGMTEIQKRSSPLGNFRNGFTEPTFENFIRPNGPGLPWDKIDGNFAEEFEKNRYIRDIEHDPTMLDEGSDVLPTQFDGVEQIFKDQMVKHLLKNI